MIFTCDAPGLMPLELAMETIRQTILPVTQTEVVALHELQGRILSENVISPVDVPGYDNSAMDGYAICVGEQEGQVFTQIGKSFAGRPFDGIVTSGQCVRIMTGAPVPEGADAVVMQENVRVANDQVEILTNLKIGEAIRRKGEDIHIGQTVLAKGRKLSPVDVGLLASIGLVEAPVYKRIKVAVFSTGDELRLPGQPLEYGCIYDSNRPALLGLLNKLGADVIDIGVVKDDLDAIRNAFVVADQQADAVIVSGGVSVGEADFTRDVLAELGEIGFWKLAIKPGKPLAFGRLPNSYFFGVPGNPVSSMVTFHQIVLPALNLLAGIGEPSSRLRIEALTSAPFKKRPGRLDYQRGICTHDGGGGYIVSPLSNQSSGVLSSITQANCFVVLERERGAVEKGETVTIEPFDDYLLAT